MLTSRLSRIAVGASLLLAVGMASGAGATTLHNQTTLSISNTTLTNATGSTVVVTTTGGSGSGATTFSVSGTHCSIGKSNGHLSASAAATCVVTAAKAASGSYKAATSAAKSFMFVAATAQAALSVSASPSTALAVGMSVTLGSSGGSGSGAVSFATSTANCTITSGVLTASAAATCAVTATKAGSTSGSHVYSSKTGTASYSFAAAVGDASPATNAHPDVATMTSVTVNGASVTPADDTANGDNWFIWQYYLAGDHWNFTPVHSGDTIVETWHVTGEAGQELVGQTVTLETAFATHTNDAVTFSSPDAGFNASNGDYTAVTNANGDVTFTLTVTSASSGNAPASSAAGDLLTSEGTNAWNRMVLVVGTPDSAYASITSGADLGAVGSTTDIISAAVGGVSSAVNQNTDLVDFILVP